MRTPAALLQALFEEFKVEPERPEDLPEEAEGPAPYVAKDVLMDVIEELGHLSLLSSSFSFTLIKFVMEV